MNRYIVKNNIYYSIKQRKWQDAILYNWKMYGYYIEPSIKQIEKETELEILEEEDEIIFDEETSEELFLEEDEEN